MEQYTGAEAFLEILNANEISSVFFNPGGDVCPIQAAVCRYQIAGKHSPRMVLCLHESVALAAAIGHYMVSGKPQVVMVHSELGTLQLAGQVHNAQWGRAPVVILAQVTAGSSRTDWQKQPFDQRVMLRNFVKWDVEIGPRDDLHEMLQQALDTAMAEPRGPVYVTYTREAFTNHLSPTGIRQPEKPLPAFPGADPALLSKMAGILLEARNPLIVAGSTGRYHENIQSLITLAETLAAPVMPGLTRMNFPSTHPLCTGIEHIGGSRGVNTALAEADVILCLDYDMPYVPAAGNPRPEARILQIDIDPLTVGRPLWGRGADIFIQADCREAMPALTRILRQVITPVKKADLASRYAQLAARHSAAHQSDRDMAKSKAHDFPVSPDWLSYCLAQITNADTILVNHLISHAASPTEQIARTEPSSLLACAGGNIGFAVGAALGAKIAAPDKMVISLLTDGGFYWGCPVSALWSTRAYQAPVLYVIFNNRSYGAIRQIVESLSESKISDELGFASGLDIDPPVDSTLIARSCGGYGRIVDDPVKVLPALKAALKQVQNGRSAIVDVMLPKGV